MLEDWRRWHSHNRFYYLKSPSAGELELAEAGLVEHKVLESGVVAAALAEPLYRQYLPSIQSL